MFKLSAQPIDENGLKTSLRHAGAGALVTFEGWVRNTNEDRDVLSLEYEGYEEVALKEGETVLAEALTKFEIIEVQCIHRVGHLQIGDMAVWVGVSAAHRDAAFKACRYVIDEIKKRLPVWKKEHYVEGDSGWINCQTGANTPS